MLIFKIRGILRPVHKEVLLVTKEVYKLEGYDTFECEFYPVPGEYATEDEVKKAACKFMQELEELQPSETSGGQEDSGIQDRVYIVKPDGTKYRYGCTCKGGFYEEGYPTC